MTMDRSWRPSVVDDVAHNRFNCLSIDRSMDRGVVVGVNEGEMMTPSICDSVLLLLNDNDGDDNKVYRGDTNHHHHPRQETHLPSHPVQSPLVVDGVITWGWSSLRGDKIKHETTTTGLLETTDKTIFPLRTFINLPIRSSHSSYLC